MAVRTDNQLLDGTYGTTNPIIPKNTITSERHRDIIDSKVSRYSIQNPDGTTPEGTLILANNQHQDEQDQHLNSLEAADVEINNRLDGLDGQVANIENSYVTNQTFTDYQQNQENIDDTQDQRLDILDNTAVKSVNTIRPDENGDVTIPIPPALNVVGSTRVAVSKSSDGTTVTINGLSTIESVESVTATPVTDPLGTYLSNLSFQGTQDGTLTFYNSQYVVTTQASVSALQQFTFKTSGTHFVGTYGAGTVIVEAKTAWSDPPVAVAVGQAILNNGVLTCKVTFLNAGTSIKCLKIYGTTSVTINNFSPS